MEAHRAGKALSDECSPDSPPIPSSKGHGLDGAAGKDVQETAVLQMQPRWQM